MSRKEMHCCFLTDAGWLVSSASTCRMKFIIETAIIPIKTSIVIWRTTRITKCISITGIFFE